MKRNLSECQSTDTPLLSLGDTLAVPGLNQHLLSFINAPDLCRLSQCNKSLKKTINDLVDLTLERDIHILQQCQTSADRIAEFRSMYPLLSKRKARLVAYIQFDSCDLNEYRYQSVAEWLRSYIDKQADIMEVIGIENDLKSDDSSTTEVSPKETVICCHFCQLNDQSKLISTEMSSFSFITCLKCLKQRDPLMLKLNPDKWSLLMDGRYDDGLEDLEDAMDHFAEEYKWTHRRMTRRDGIWLMRVGNGCDNDQDWGALRIEFTKERPKNS